MDKEHTAERLAKVQRAYDEFIHDLFGEKVPRQSFRENLASGYLLVAGADKSDWQRMALYAKSNARLMLKKRDVLVKHELDANK
jgi:hypothetical protein